MFSVLFVSIFVFSIYFDGVRSAVILWRSSGTYSYGLLVLPIALYLFWDARARLAGLSPVPAIGGGLLIVAASLAWGLGAVAGVAELAQFAIIGVIQGCVLTLFGWRICRQVLIPLAYLWLLVPTGAFLLPGLQAVTATLAAGLLDLAGIPSFRDGLLIEVSSGQYLVEAGCAGLNFVLAALALGLAFADLVYRDWSRRLLFILLMIVLAVVGNGVRVFALIALAQWSGHAAAILDDHLLYGWVGFSGLILAAMMLGLRFQQARPPRPVARDESPPPVGNWRSWAAVSLSCMLLAAPVPLAVRAVEPPAGQGMIRPPVLSCGALPAFPPDPLPPMAPSNADVDALAESQCVADGLRVHLTLAWLRRPLRHGKLFGLEDRLAAGSGWHVIKRETASVTLGGQAVPVTVRTWGLGERRRLDWSLRWAGGAWRAAGLETMAADLLADLTGRRDAMLVVAAVDDDGDAARSALREVLGRSRPERWVGAGSLTP